jgi:LmbE family N-acetylglucosaminyl deacetylase
MLQWKPAPETDRPLRILCLGAHSDDIEIGCGASMLQLIGSNPSPEVRWVVFSGDRSRAGEARASADYWLNGVGAKQIDLHTFRDGFFPDAWAAIKEEFEKLKHAFEPDLIFTHFRHDLHQDHRIVHELTWNTFRSHCIVEYEVPKYDGDLDSTNAYIPVTEESAKAKATALMKFFGTQSNKHWFSEELFLGLMRIRGMECCAPSGYAEGFYTRKACLGIG